MADQGGAVGFGVEVHDQEAAGRQASCAAEQRVRGADEAAGVVALAAVEIEPRGRATSNKPRIVIEDPRFPVIGNSRESERAIVPVKPGN